MKQLPHLEEEIKLWNQNKIVAGVDEVGRGCLAGPVVAAAVILPMHYKPIFQVNDSKRLNNKQREFIYKQIINSDIKYSVSFIDNHIIDDINILQATFLAMTIATNNLKEKPNFLLIDGNRYNNNTIPYKTIIKGDTISFSIAAASVIAKVERDKYLINSIHKEFPNYYFDKNKGYGTKKHFTSLKTYGATRYHRQTFLKKFNLKLINLF